MQTEKRTTLYLGINRDMAADTGCSFNQPANRAEGHFYILLFGRIIPFGMYAVKSPED
jgi:hypothetical protein